MWRQEVYGERAYPTTEELDRAFFSSTSKSEMLELTKREWQEEYEKCIEDGKLRDIMEIYIGLFISSPKHFEEKIEWLEEFSGELTQDDEKWIKDTGEEIAKYNKMYEEARDIEERNREMESVEYAISRRYMYPDFTIRDEKTRFWCLHDSIERYKRNGIKHEVMCTITLTYHDGTVTDEVRHVLVYDLPKDSEEKIGDVMVRLTWTKW
jgi:hypothetical protein